MKKTPHFIPEVWEENFGQAKAFFDANGRFPHYSDDRRLRQWALVWYRRFGSTDSIRLARLKSIGFFPHDRWLVWERHFEQARRVWDGTGHRVTARTGTESYNYFKQWLLHNARKYPERVARLAAIGFRIKPRRDVFDRNFDRARAFYDRHGRFPTRADDLVLAEWARRWYRSHAQDCPDRAVLLTSIGFVP